MNESALTQPQRYLQAAQGLDATAFVSTPDYVSHYTQLPEHWEYDINPGSGVSRTTYLGEVFIGGTSALNQAATKGDIAAATTGVSSFNTRTGAVTLTLADVTTVGAAPINNTALQGNPTAVTQAQGTSDTTLATTAFVTQALANQPGVYSWNGRQGAVTMTLSDITAAGGAPIQSPMFLGTPQAPTAAPNTDNQQIATTAFVMTQMGNSVVSWNGRIGNVTMTLSDVTSVGGAPLNAPAFTGVATAVTPPPGTATTQLATTQFVTNAVQAATVGVASFNTRTGAVTLQAADISQAGGALLAGPALTGVPTAPTAPATTNTNQIATCAFVETALAGASVVSSFNTRTGAVTLSSADVANAGALMTTGGTLTGPLVLQGNASAALNPVPFQQLTSAIAGIAVPAPSTTAPLMDGTAAVGTGTTFARADHVHPSDTSRMPVTGGTFTGAVTLPAGSTIAGYLPLTGGTLTGGLSGTSVTMSSGTVNGNIGVSGQVTTATLVSTGNTTIQGTLGVNSSISDFLGRIISQNSGNNPSFTCYDPTIGAVGVFLGGGGIFYVADMTAGGTFQTLRAAFLVGGGLNIYSGTAGKPGGGAWSDTSDDRVKTVQGDYSKGLAEILQLNPRQVIYLGNDTTEAPPADETVPYMQSVHYNVARAQTVFTTLIAQEVETVFPEMVSKGSGYIGGQAVNDLRQLDTSPLIYALVNSVKQLTARVQTLEAGAGITPPATQTA